MIRKIERWKIMIREKERERGFSLPRPYGNYGHVMKNVNEQGQGIVLLVCVESKTNFNIQETYYIAIS